MESKERVGISEKSGQFQWLVNQPRRAAGPDLAGPDLLAAAELRRHSWCVTALPPGYSSRDCRSYVITPPALRTNSNTAHRQPTAKPPTAHNQQGEQTNTTHTQQPADKHCPMCTSSCCRQCRQIYKEHWLIRFCDSSPFPLVLNRYLIVIFDDFLFPQALGAGFSFSGTWVNR